MVTDFISESVQFELTKAQIALLKKYFRQDIDNFRIVGIKSEQLIFFHFMIKEEIRSKITKEIQTFENWFYLKVKCEVRETFWIQMTNDHALENFKSFLQLTSGQIRINMYLNNCSEFSTRLNIITQSFSFQDLKNKYRIETIFYPRENSPYSLLAIKSYAFPTSVFDSKMYTILNHDLSDFGVELIAQEPKILTQEPLEQIPLLEN